MRTDEYVDDSALRSVLDGLNFSGSEIRTIVKGANRKAAKAVLLEAVRSKFKNEKFEHIDVIKRSIKVVDSKSTRWPGVNVVVKGPDVPINHPQPSGRFWKLKSYIYLVLFGNYNKDRITKKGIQRGDVKGQSPNKNSTPFLEAKNEKGGTAMTMAVRNLIPEIEAKMKRLAAKRKR